MADEPSNEADVNELLQSVKTSDHYRRDKEISETFQHYYRELHRILLSPVIDAERAGPAKAERKRFMEFIALTVFTLRKFDCEDALITKLMSFYGALMDLQNGRAHPILQQTVKDHASAESTEWWRIRATLAAALEFLIRAKMPLRDAMRKLGRTKQIKKILKRNADPAKSVCSLNLEGAAPVTQLPTRFGKRRSVNTKKLQEIKRGKSCASSSFNAQKPLFRALKKISRT
jgi:hypothetical protein